MDYQQTIPIYSKDNCPDSLTWDNKLGVCSLECIYPVFSDTQNTILYLIDDILAPIGFILCYFYCITTFIRPLAHKFPNSILFQFHFTLMLTSVSGMIPMILGRQYVFCDSTTEFATYNNWSCVLSGVLFYYFYLNFISWNAMYHIITVLRVYLIHIPKYSSSITFIICYFGWPFITAIVGVSLDYLIAFPGFFTCNIGRSEEFSWIAVLAMYYVHNIIIFICVILISIRMIRVKVRTKLKWRVLFIKQARLLIYWLYFLALVIVTTILIAMVTTTDRTEEDLEEYVICVLIAGDDEDCTLSIDGYPPYSVLLINHIILLGYPIVVFILFGCRKELFLFWKEYIIYVFKNKTIPLQFSPSFDPNSTISQTITTSSDSTKISKETTKLIKRIKEL